MKTSGNNHAESPDAKNLSGQGNQLSLIMTKHLLCYTLYVKHSLLNSVTLIDFELEYQYAFHIHQIAFDYFFHHNILPKQTELHSH